MERWLVGTVIAGCMVLAISNAFVLDDAFISFRYAHNLVETGELTWNPGEAVPVEGYTNFLWTLLLAAAQALGIEPVFASQALGLTALLGSLLITYRLAAGVLESARWAAVAVGFLGTNYTFSCFATGGLETQLQAFLITTCAWVAWQIAHEAPTAGRYAMLSILTAAAVMTRLDSALPSSILFAWAWIVWWRRSPPARATVVRIIASAGPVLLLLVPWLSWKLAYYGDVLPNTYYAKVLPISLELLAQGLGYGLNFVYSYQLLPILVLAIARYKRWLRREDLLAFICVILAWSAYIVRIGGGFMEFRALVPMLPLAFIVTTFLIAGVQPRAAQAFLAALVVLGSGFHALNFKETGDLETISSLRSHIESESANWPRVGQVLGELFAAADEPKNEDPVRIATTAAGAIPYYSQLPTVDMLALNDPWLARQAPVGGIRSGHSKRADFAYLLRRRVHLVLGHPWVDRLTGPSAGEPTLPVRRVNDIIRVDPTRLPAGARLVEIPIDATYGIKVLYLVPHPRVDEVIEQRGLKTWVLDRGV